MNDYPEVPFYEYRFFAEANKMCEWLNAKPANTRIISCFTTGAGSYHLVIVREKQVGE